LTCALRTPSSGAKAPAYLAGIMYGLKPVSFALLKPVPFTLQEQVPFIAAVQHG
jgi:hypothetical protein